MACRGAKAAGAAKGHAMKLPFGGNLTPVERRVLEQADAQSHKKASDIEVGVGRLILTSPDGTRYSVTVSDLGMLVLAELA